MNRSLTATLRFAQTSSIKMQLAAKLVRGKKASDALNMLAFAPKKSAKILLKVLKSAVANAKNNANIEESALYISRVDIGRWAPIKRMRFVARSRVHAYEKHRSFVRVVLDTK